MARSDEMAAQLEEPEAVPVPEKSGLAKVSFYDLYLFLWKLTAAVVVFIVPFLILYLMLSGHR